MGLVVSLSHVPPPFEFGGTELANCRVTTTPVVKRLDVLKDSALKLVTCQPSMPIEQIRIESGEEALDHSVVVGISDRTHSARYTSVTKRFQPVMAGG